MGETVSNNKFDFIDDNAFEINISKPADDSGSHVLEIAPKGYQGHDVSVERPASPSEEAKKPMLRISVSATNSQGVRRSEEWVQKEFQRTLSLLNEAAGDHFENLFDTEKRASIHEVLAQKTSGYTVTQYGEEAQAVRSIRIDPHSDDSARPPADAESPAERTVEGAAAQEMVNAGTAGGKNPLRALFDTLRNLWVRCFGQHNTQRPPAMASSRASLEAEPMRPSKYDELTNVEVALAKFASGGYRIDVENGMLKAEPRDSASSAISADAIRHSLKQIFDHAGKQDIDNKYIPHLYAKLLSLPSYPKELERHPDIKLMNTCLQLMVNLQLADYKSKPMEKAAVDRLIHEYNNCTDAVRADPSLQNSQALKSAMCATGQALIAAKTGAVELPSLESLDHYVNLIAAGENKGAINMLLMGHRNNDELQGLVGALVDKMRSPDTTQSERNNLLQFAHDYISSNTSIPLMPHSQQRAYIDVIDLCEAGMNDPELQDMAEALKNTAGSRLYTLAKDCLEGRVPLPADPGAARAYLNEFILSAEVMVEEQNPLAASLAPLIRQAEEKSASLQEAAAAPVAAAPAAAAPAAAPARAPSIFEGMSSEEIYRNLAALTEQSFSTIQLADLDDLAWSKPKTQPYAALTKDIALFNQISGLCIREILGTGWTPADLEGKSDAEKANLIRNQQNKTQAMIHKLLEAGKMAKEEHNQCLLFAIAAAMSNSIVNRIIEHDQMRLSKEDKKVLEMLAYNTDTSLSYQNIRQELIGSFLKGEKSIPYIGILLSDLTFIDNGNQNTLQKTRKVGEQEEQYTVINGSRASLSVAVKLIVQELQSGLQASVRETGSVQKGAIEQALALPLDENTSYNMSRTLYPREGSR